MMAFLYGLFLISGAAALVYEVAWVRSLSLVFGGSHLAVTTVLSVFMGGLALGGRWLGGRADRTDNPLRLYAALELGIAAFALLFLGLMHVYPSVYGPLARVAPEDRLWLSSIRVLFAVAAMIGPATLMGGTLPVLVRFASGRPGSVGRQVSVLYGVNTLGAVAGSLAAGFLLLRTMGVTATILTAVAANAVAGAAALLLSRRAREATGPPPSTAADAGDEPGEDRASPASVRLVVWGIGLSGFCALGYEVLWTRILSLVVGTSVYSFTIILVAFLAGIGLGSEAHGLVHRRTGARWSVLGFAGVQVAIGSAAFAVTVLMRELPSHATWLQERLLDAHATEFGARQWASFAVALAFLVVPAFLMGVAFPLAARIRAAGRSRVGAAVGEVLTSNTVGAILGAAVSGFVLIHALGVERSLQVLAVLNVGVGLVVGGSLLGRAASWAAAVPPAVLLAALVAWPGWGRFWDQKYFAIYRNNQRSAFDTPEERRDALANTDVLYYFEGANEIVSVIRPRGARQAFIVNGRPEATTSPADVQCQRTLGHLPMLLHPAPRSVFVLGTGTGMTLGATAIHPGVERIVLAEIEPGVLGAARTFAEYNHGVLDDPRLHVVFNDGRNFLATTRERFDVITADPIHPWSGGAAYLYTREYFDAVAAHLNPGGIASQWLPIYELTPHDVQTVVRTFAGSFRHVAVWLTHYDAELVGSDSPLVFDEEALAHRIAEPAIRADLRSVEMGSAEDFLSYFVLGDAGTRAFARGGAVNTDDNLFLEFSAPRSMGVARVMGDNVRALAGMRESILGYLARPADESERAARRARWERNLSAARLYDRAHALLLWGEVDTPEFEQLMSMLGSSHPDYAPYRFLETRRHSALAATPRLVDQVEFAVAGGTLRIAAVEMRVGARRAALVLVDNDRRELYGQRYLDGEPEALEGMVRRLTAEAMDSLRRAYQVALADARRGGADLPHQTAAAERLRAAVVASVGPPP